MLQPTDPDSTRFVFTLTDNAAGKFAIQEKTIVVNLLLETSDSLYKCTYQISFLDAELA